MVTRGERQALGNRKAKSGGITGLRVSTRVSPSTWAQVSEAGEHRSPSNWSFWFAPERKPQLNNQVYPSEKGKRLPQTNRKTTKNFQEDQQLQFSCFSDHYKLFILELQCQFNLYSVF